MASISPKLPLTYNSADGFTMIKNFPQMVKQNFKMLILTIPGERVMEPTFGVGITRFLFEHFQEGTYMKIDSRIREQTRRYMPFIKISEINFNSSEQDMNKLAVSITYAIPQLGTTDLLQITI